MRKLQDILVAASGQDFPVTSIDRDIDFRAETAVIPHLHHGLEIKLVGNLKSQKEASVQDWQAEKAIIVLPEVVHSSFNKEERRRSISILLEENTISCVCCGEMFPESIPMANLPVFGINASAAAKFLCSWVEEKRQSPHWDLHAMIILKSLMSSLILCIETDAAQETQSSPVSNAANYIRRHYYRNKLSVEDVAKHVGVTPNYLLSIFHKKMGVTIRQYLIRTRLEQAKILLAGGRCLVKDAARLTGWNSAYYFSNSYRKFFGMPPSKGGESQDKNSGKA
ncbi:MAG: hypothetical protein A2X49_15465 [Lentisphaerae bacterium GWF2_52_8]|nr:MAG: hypothetical protein A2X49_15465 [Lentisphaerae bacterium GWF2_52_8]